MKVSFLVIVALIVGSFAVGCGEAAGTPPTDTETGGDGAGGTDAGPDRVEPKSTFPCTEQGIRDAIQQGGGPLEFACEGPTTVVTSREIEIDEDVVLDGGGDLTVDANGEHRVFSVSAGVEATLRGLTITGGFMDSSADDSRGGGILNEGTLVVRESVVRGNQASTGGGLSSSGVLTLFDSVVVNNTANDGGGIASSGWLIVRDSYVATNRADAGYGGGIFNESATAFLINAAVSENRARLGAGVFNWGTMSLTDSSVSQNRTGASDEDLGGGIFNEGGDLSLRDTVVSANMGAGVCNCRTSDDGGNGTLKVTSSGISSNESWGIVNVATAHLLDTTVIGNADGGIASEKMLTLTNCDVYGAVHSTCETSEVHFFESSIHGECTGMEGSTMVSHGNNVESPGNTCYLDHETDRPNEL